MKLKWAKPDCCLIFNCPACGYSHPFYVKTPKHPDGTDRTLPSGKPWPVWTWNGSMDSPTFEPSLLVYGDPPKTPRCHSFVRAGRIEFCSDSTHDMAGKVVEIPDFDD